MRRCASRRPSRSDKFDKPRDSAGRSFQSDRPGSGAAGDAVFLAGEMSMSPFHVFCRTLQRSSAVFLGVAAIFLHPPLEWSSASHGGLVAQQSGSEARVDALISALKD